MILNPDTILQNDTLTEIFKISNNLDFAILSPISSNKNYPNFTKIKNLCVVNSDIFWQIDNKTDIINFLENINEVTHCKILYQRKIISLASQVQKVIL